MNIQTTLCYLGVIFGVFDSIFARTSEELRITLPNGSRLLGRGLRSRNGRIIKAFMGIPYAKPPIGELRFKVIFTDCSVWCYSYVKICVSFNRNT